MEYCARCLYPLNAKPTIIFDEDTGICSGCNYHASRTDKFANIDWAAREQIFAKICDEAKKMAKERGNAHDCIIPISGGKDSYYQVWLLKEKYGMNPLLVTFNHCFNTPIGNWNLMNLLHKSGCDHIRYSVSVDSARKLSRYMLEKVGDITWHYHAGIRTLPFRIAVEKNIPLIVWGEHGFAELTGIVTLEDFVEFTKWTRKEHDMRGIEAHELIGKGGIEYHDIAPYIFPTDAQIEVVNVRGIYLSNFFPWNAKAQGELMMKEWGFSPIAYRRERTFNLYSKIEDHANDVHDYLKYLKFGYGRATDDASMEIRHGRLTRDQGLVLVKEYDATEPSTLEMYCDFMGITKAQFYQFIEPMRDKNIWQKNKNDEWEVKDSVFLNRTNYLLEMAAQVPVAPENVFDEKNRHLYFNPNNPPKLTGNPVADVFSNNFVVL